MFDWRTCGGVLAPVGTAVEVEIDGTKWTFVPLPLLVKTKTLAVDMDKGSSLGDRLAVLRSVAAIVDDLMGQGLAYERLSPSDVLVAMDSGTRSLSNGRGYGVWITGVNLQPLGEHGQTIDQFRCLVECCLDGLGPRAEIASRKLARIQAPIAALDLVHGIMPDKDAILEFTTPVWMTWKQERAAEIQARVRSREHELPFYVPPFADQATVNANAEGYAARVAAGVAAIGENDVAPNILGSIESAGQDSTYWRIANAGPKLLRHLPPRGTDGFNGACVWLMSHQRYRHHFQNVAISESAAPRTINNPSMNVWEPRVEQERCIWIARQDRQYDVAWDDESSSPAEKATQLLVDTMDHLELRLLVSMVAGVSEFLAFCQDFSSTDLKGTAAGVFYWIESLDSTAQLLDAIAELRPGLRLALDELRQELDIGVGSTREWSPEWRICVELATYLAEADGAISASPTVLAAIRDAMRLHTGRPWIAVSHSVVVTFHRKNRIGQILSNIVALPSTYDTRIALLSAGPTPSEFHRIIKQVTGTTPEPEPHFQVDMVYGLNAPLAIFAMEFEDGRPVVMRSDEKLVAVRDLGVFVQFFNGSAVRLFMFLGSNSDRLAQAVGQFAPSIGVDSSLSDESGQVFLRRFLEELWTHGDARAATHRAQATVSTTSGPELFTIYPENGQIMLQVPRPQPP